MGIESQYLGEINIPEEHRAEYAQQDCDAALAAFITTVGTALKSGEKVQLIGFGSFEVKERAARTGRNPRTKETVEIPASKAPVFKAGQAFKDAIR